MKGIKDFVQGAKSLSRNPLGIIALFIVLIYALAALVLLAGSSKLSSTCERLPLIWFLVLFPVSVLVSFLWLVAKHHGKLYGPADYSNDDNFFRTFGPGTIPPKSITNGSASFATSDDEPVKNPTTNEAILGEKYAEVVKTGYCLLHAAQVVRERTTPRTGHYRVRAWIEPIQGRPLSDIASVTYRVWEDFNRKTITTTSEETQFDLWMNVYGEFPVLALVKMKDGTNIILQRYIDLPGRPPD
jgi:hypothetical protein